jgi:hypothetical protein
VPRGTLTRLVIARILENRHSNASAQGCRRAGCGAVRSEGLLARSEARKDSSKVEVGDGKGKPSGELTDHFEGRSLNDGRAAAVMHVGRRGQPGRFQPFAAEALKAFEPFPSSGPS